MELSAYSRVLSTLLQGVLSQTGVALAAKTELSGSTISRLKDHHFDAIARLIVAMGLDVVPAGASGPDDERTRRLERKVADLLLLVDELQGRDS